jgi:hypothetical protein
MPIKAAAVFDDSTAASATKRLAAVAMACNDSAIRGEEGGRKDG